MSERARSRVVGTAGHIDHGKTALVHALTEVWTDRLPEEKRRGISIDLGFAPLDLGPDAPPASVVDVPGHEGFVRNMVAGSTGIDAVLFTVAADEGFMPQSREHLIVLEALGVRNGVVAVTKADLVSPEWSELVVETVSEELAGSCLESAEIVVVSATLGTGLERLRRALIAVLAALPVRPLDFPFRLPVDRSFQVAGAGTVVTGTVWSGAVSEGETLRLLPVDDRVRVRSLEVHGRPVNRAEAGTRAAVALAGPGASGARRGVTLVGVDHPWSATRRVDARLWLSRSAPRSLESGDRIRVHHGTTEVMARLRLYGEGAVAPGEAGEALLLLERPLVPAVGDRLVIRAYSPVTTIGGGVVLARRPPRTRGIRRTERGRLLAGLADANGPERVIGVLGAAGARGVEESGLPLDTGIGAAELESISIGENVESHGGRWFARAAREEAMGRIAESVARHHETHPLEIGQPLSAARRAVRDADPALVEAAIDALIEEGALERRGAGLAVAGREIDLDPENARLLERLERRYREAGLEAPETEEVAGDLAVDGTHLRELLRYLEREGRLVKLASDWYADAEAVDRARHLLVNRLARDGAADTGACKETLGVSRKYLIPVLEYLDRSGVTRREGNRRILVRGAS
ncbi:MAG: selenocysteine-specific translation elongation factor [Gemmatimonadota bacterium]